MPNPGNPYRLEIECFEQTKIIWSRSHYNLSKWSVASLLKLEWSKSWCYGYSFASKFTQNTTKPTTPAPHTDLVDTIDSVILDGRKSIKLRISRLGGRLPPGAPKTPPYAGCFSDFGLFTPCFLLAQRARFHFWYRVEWRRVIPLLRHVSAKRPPNRTDNSSLYPAFQHSILEIGNR